MVTAAHLCAKNHWTEHFKWMNCIVCKMYFSKAITKKKKKRLGLREMERRRDFLLYCCWVSDYNSQDQSGIKITPKIGRGKKDVRGRKWTLWECLGRQFLRIPDPVLIQVQDELDISALPQFRYYHHLLKAAWLGKWWLFKPSLSSLIFFQLLATRVFHVNLLREHLCPPFSDRKSVV